MIVDLAAITVLGLPHGALDPEIARDHLISRLGRWWFPIFAVPYLTLAAGVLLAWHLAPLMTLALFLAMSAWHFGEAKGLAPWRILARGGAPIALPVLFHPAATALLLSSISQTVIPACPIWLIIASYGWIALAAFELYDAVRRGSLDKPVIELAVLAGLYACLLPLTALTIYFVCLHSPAHMREIVTDPDRAPRVTSMTTAILRATPITALTLLIGSCLWPLYSGDDTHRLLALVIQGLAALTLPHMLLEQWSGKKILSKSKEHLASNSR